MRKLPTDITRCLGLDCQKRNDCQRFLGRNDNGRLSYIQHGVFEDGDCIYRIPVDVEDEQIERQEP